MRWYEGVLYALEQTGVDETLKPVCESVEAGTARFRKLPWKAHEVQIAGNTHDEIRRTWYTAAPRERFAGVESIELDNATWYVEGIADFGGGCAVTVRRAKP